MRWRGFGSLMPARYSQPLPVFDRSLQLFLRIGEGPGDGRVQPLLVASQCFVALLRECVNQIAHQGFHATHGLYTVRAAKTNLIESQSQKILPRRVWDDQPEGSLAISNRTDFEAPTANPQQQVLNLI